MSAIVSEYTDEDILYEYETVGDLIQNQSLQSWWNAINIDINTPVKRLREAVQQLSMLARKNHDNINYKKEMLQPKLVRNAKPNVWIFEAWGRRIQFYIQNIKYWIACTNPLLHNNFNTLVECLGCGNSMKKQMFFCRQYLTSLQLVNNAQYQWSEEHTVCVWCKNALWRQLKQLQRSYQKNVKQILQQNKNKVMTNLMIGWWDARVNEWRYAQIKTVVHLRKLVVQITLHDVDTFASSSTQILRLSNMDNCQYFIFKTADANNDYFDNTTFTIDCQHQEHLQDWLTVSAAINPNNKNIKPDWQVPVIFNAESKVPYPVQKYHIVNFTEICRSVELFDLLLAKKLLK